MSTPESSTIEEEIEGESDSLSSSQNTERVLSSAEDRRDSEDSLNVTGRRNSEDSLSPKRHTLEKQETEQKEKDPNEVTEGVCRQKEKDSKGGDNQVEEEQTRSQDRMKDVDNMETVVEAMETDIQAKTIRKEEVEEKANQKQINTITLEVGQIIYAPTDPPPISMFVPTRQHMATDDTEPDGTKDKSDRISDVIEGKSTADKDDRVNDEQNNIYTTQPSISLSEFAPKIQHLDDDDDDDDGTEPAVMKDKSEGITDKIEEKSTKDKDDVVYYNQTNIYNIPSSLSIPLLDPARQDLHTDNTEPDISKYASQEITEIAEMTTVDKDDAVHNVVDADFYNTESPLSLSTFVATRKDLDIDNTEFGDKKDNSHRIREINEETATPDKVDVVDYGQKDFYNTHLKNQLATYGDYKKYEQTTMTDNQRYHNDDDDDEHIGSVSENDDDEKERRPNDEDDDDFKSEKSFFRTSIFPSLSTPDVSALYEKPSGMDRGVSEELLPSYHDNDRYSIWPRMELVQSTTLKHFKPPNTKFSTKANSFKAPNPKFSTKANTFKHPTTTSTSLPSLRWSYQDLRASDLFEESTDKFTTDMKRLEDSYLRDSEEYALRGVDGSQAKIPARIRDIITRNLSSEGSFGSGIMTQPSVAGLQDENRLLSQELNRVEDLLSASRAERDELSIKYNALSERLENSLRSDSGLDTTNSEMASRNLAQQNIDLRRKLEEEHTSYKRKLQAYQDGQQRQAQLVQKLQAKLLQYKKKCQDLEDTVRTKDIEITRVYSNRSTNESRYSFVDTEANNNLQSVLEQLEEEKQRCNGLEHVNKMLREQLDQATSTNQQLSVDIHKLTRDWQIAREELEAREVEWREEEKSFNEFYNSEHSRLLSLWRAIVTFRRQFGEMKAATERDLSGVKGEMQRAARYMHSACLNFSAHTRKDDTQAQVSLDRERSEKMSLESQLRDRNRDVHDLQDRINELTMKNERLKIQLEEKEKAISFIQNTRAQMERAGEEVETDTARHLREETEALHSALRNIAEAVINDADQSIEGEEGRVPRQSASPAHRASSPTFRASSISPTRSKTPYARLRSPQRSVSPMTRSRSPTFADSTFSAVQAALNKRQLQVSDLRAKLNATRDNSTSLKRALEDASNERKRMELVILNLKEDLETVRREKDDSSRDRDRMKNVLNQTGSEKTQLERVRTDLNTQIESLQKDNERLKATNGELQRLRDNLEDEKDDIVKDKDRQVKENERCQRVIEQLEQKMSSIREELVATKEALNRALLDKEVLDGQNRETNDALSRSQLQKAEQEVEINHLRREEAALKDALMKLQALNEGLGQDKIELNRIILQLEAEKASLNGEKSALEQEKSGIREELVRVEQEKMDLDTEKHGLNHTLELSEMSRQQLEEEIAGLTKDKQEVIAQLNVLSRQKHALADELLSGRREVERLQTVYERVIKEKEMLTQDKGELIVQITACERENRQQGEIISAYAADKDSLEGALCETQQHVRELEVRMAQLEGENQELIVKKENLQAEISRLEKEKQADFERFEHVKDGLNQRLQQQTRDSQMALTKEKQAHEEDVERLTREREGQRVEYDNDREQLIHQHNMEKEELASTLERQKEELLQELASLQRDRDDALLVSENDKQQVISLMEQEKAILQEKNTSLNTDFNQLNLEFERLKRESQLQQEQSRASIGALQGEMRNIRTQFEETMESHDREVKDLTAQIREVSRHREAALREIDELKTQLTVVEETRDTIRRDLIEANRAIREGEEVKEQLRREIVETKRAIGEEVREKDLIGKTADELRNKVKKLEGEKNEMSRVIQEARQRIGVLNEQKAGVQQEAAELRNNLREVEKARLEARRELQELRRQVKMLDGERSKLDKEVTELQTRVAKDEEKEEEARKTSFDLKQKVVETEASREALRKDLANLQRKMAELIDEARMKERDYQLALEDSRRSERKLEDNRRNLEIAFENSSAEAADLRLKLSGTEGRVGALEAALARLDSIKRELEFKLSSIVSTLRRTVGFRLDRPRSKSPGILRSRSPSPRRSRPTSPSKGFDNTYATTTEGRGSPIPRTGSPARTGSPFRSRNRSFSPGRVDCTDVDIEAVRAALRDFVSQLASAERERDDALSQVRSLTTQLKDLEDERERVENRLRILQKSLGEAEEGKRDIDGRLASAQTALMLQEETIRRNERERKALADKVLNLERSIASGETEKRQLQEKISKLKQNESKLEEDKKQMRISLDDAENRCTKIELNRRALEGELQRGKLAINDRETENQVLQDRTENLIKQIQDLESKSQSLQLTIDRLNMNLAKTEEEGHKTKDKVQALNLSLSDSNAMINDLEETVAKLQRGLTSSEHDRRVLQERLDATRQALSDAKKQNHTLMERLQVVQHDMAATEVRCSELEGQMKQTNNLLEQRKESEKELNMHLQRICADKQALQERMASMSRTLSSMENEKREIERSTMRLEKDKSALRKTLDKVEREKLQTEEFAHKSVYNRDNVDRTLSRLEEDNISLQRQLQEMQAALAEAEQTHAQRLIDLTTRHRAEAEMETERLRSAQLQAERLLEAREKAHRQKVKGLEEQNSLLKDQISQELRKRQLYISKSTRTGDEIRDLRSVLDNSLTNVIRDSNLDPILFEHEARKLEESLTHPATPRRRSPLRGSSPGRLGGYTSTPQFRAGPRSPILRRKIKQ